VSDRRTIAFAVADKLSGSLVGDQLQDLERREHDWAFVFRSGIRLQVVCRWRIISGDQIAFADRDNGQQFGLPAPLDGVNTSKALLWGNAIQGISIRADTADLTISFGNGILLEILNDSSGYEGWEMCQAPYGVGFQIIAMGGGQLAVWRLDLPDIYSDDPRNR
jgi:hypothetical protein